MPLYLDGCRKRDKRGQCNIATPDEEYLDHGPCQLRPVKFTSPGYQPYVYRPGQLEAVAANYDSYLGLPVSAVTALDAKCDFDRALNSVGNGHWAGMDADLDKSWRDFRNYGVLQKAVLAIIWGIENTKCGIEDPGAVQDIAFKLMANYLNKGDVWTDSRS